MPRLTGSIRRSLRTHCLEFRLAMLTLDRVAEEEKHRQAMEKMDQQIQAIEASLREANAAAATAAISAITEGAK